MLLMESESKLCPKNLKNVSKSNKESSLNPEAINVIVSVGANCNEELGVHVIAEGSGHSIYSGKRDASSADHTTSKRCKFSDDETQIVTLKANEIPPPRLNDIKNETVADIITDNYNKEAQKNGDENNWVVKVKVECVTDNCDEQNITKSPSGSGSSNITDNCDEQNITNTPSGSGSSNPVDIKPAVKIEQADASSTSRESCRFGIRCYRRNQMHRVEEAHPGDHDYRRPIYPPPPKGTPDCLYGDKCYRRNPIHFQQFNHPPETDFEQNYKNYRLRQRRRLQNVGDNRNIYNSELDDDNGSEDPFYDDDALDSDYEPNSDEDDEEDYDACDRAEE